MLNHASLSPNEGSQKAPIRRGRGNGSGKGTFSGRGCKGQGSRTGKGKFNPAFEGGQTPLFRRLPKLRGFTSLNQIRFEVVNLDDLQALADAGVTEIDTLLLVDKGLVRKVAPVKILGSGELKAKLTVKANAASASAKAAIEKAGGTLELA
ncbi:MAG: large subunit ribosomal protein [Patescibacteria group bacterium]|nr:large subunit ribosomal protein [Patescibacteria group bacterium]